MAVPTWHDADQKVTTNTAANPLTIQRPDNLAAGDLWWVTLGLRHNGGGAPPVPEGWHLPTVGGVPASAGTFSVFPHSRSIYRVVSNPAAEPASIQLPTDQNWDHWRLVSGRISGADTADPVHAISSLGNIDGISSFSRSLTTTIPDCLLLGHCVLWTSTISHSLDSTPAEMEVLDWTEGIGGAVAGRYALSREDQPGEGPTGPRTWTTWTTMRWAGHLVAIRSSNGPPPPPPPTRPGMFLRYLRNGDWGR